MFYENIMTLWLNELLLDYDEYSAWLLDFTNDMSNLCQNATLHSRVLFMFLASSSIQFSFWHDEIRPVFRFRIRKSSHIIL